MGGFGSGRQNGKALTSDMYVLDVRQLNRGGYLKQGYFFNWAWSRGGQRLADINIRVEEGRVRLIYKSRSSGSEWEQLDYSVLLTYTACNFGGQRAWWKCPAISCGRKVAKLYGGRMYACRHCHQLAYRTQRQQRHARAMTKADKIRDKLGLEPGILNGNGNGNGNGDKPKGMHWATFERLEAQHDALVNRSIAGSMEKFGMFTKVNCD